MIINPWISLWLIGCVLWLAVVVFAYLSERGEPDPPAIRGMTARRWAQMATATPVWPVAVLIFVGRGVVRLFRHATYQDKPEGDR